MELASIQEQARVWVRSDDGELGEWAGAEVLAVNRCRVLPPLLSHLLCPHHKYLRLSRFQRCDRGRSCGHRPSGRESGVARE